MKKLLFLATFSFLFIQLAQAIVLPQADFSKEIIFSEAATASKVTTQVEIIFGNGGNLNNLDLINSQQLSFKNLSGASVLVDLQVQSDVSIGTTLNVVFSITTNLTGLTADTSQRLDFVDVITGATASVDFIVIEIIGH